MNVGEESRGKTKKTMLREEKLKEGKKKRPVKVK